MPLDPAVIGRAGRTLIYEVEAGHVAAFADAIGDPAAVYRDRDAATQAGFPAIPAPPTMVTAFLPDPGIREGLDMDWSRILHGGEEMTFERPLYVGDRVHVTPRIADVYVKEGRSGVMDFLVIETEGRDDEGQLVYAVRRTIVVKRSTP